MAAREGKRVPGRVEAYFRSGQLWRDDRYALVFVLIMATIISTAFFTDGPVGLVVTLALQALTLVVALRTSEAGPRAQRIGGITAVLCVVGVAIVVATGNPGPAAVAYAVSMLALVAVTPLVIIHRLTSHPTISINTVAGAADVYLLFGLFFAVVYFFLGIIDGHAAVPAAQGFFAANRPVFANDLIYFSYVTLATVGYGDLTAASALGRMLCITEALLGQLYLVTVVAVLVANIGHTRQRPLLGGSGEPEMTDPPAEDVG